MKESTQRKIPTTHKTFHFLKHKKVGPKVYVAVKLDLNKAYDRIYWDFFFKVMKKMGFDSKWIGRIQQCVCSVKYSFVLNGGQIGNLS